MSEHVDIPLWMIPILVAIFTFLFSYIWTTLNGRVKKLEEMEENTLKKQLENPLLTISIHETICGKVWERFEKTLVEKLESMEKNFGLMIENAILKGLHNYDLEQIGSTGNPTRSEGEKPKG
jgi:hypothetical protein